MSTGTQRWIMHLDMDAFYAAVEQRDDPTLRSRPSIRGLRIRVTDLLEMLAAGATQAEILEDFRYLEAADISAALAFAAHQTDHPILRVA